MVEENKDQPDPQETQPSPSQGMGGGDQPSQKPPKLFTQDEVNAMVAKRLAKQRESIRKEIMDELSAEAEKAKLDAVERAKLEADEWRAKAEAAEAARIQAERKAVLAPKVTDVNYALFQIEQAKDKYLAEDGSVNVDALLADFPVLAPKQNGTPPATGAGGGLRSTQATIAELEERLSKARTRGERVAIQTRLNELRKRG